MPGPAAMNWARTTGGQFALGLTKTPGKIPTDGNSGHPALGATVSEEGFPLATVITGSSSLLPARFRAGARTHSGRWFATA
jgi:hypothetical protein